MTKMHENELDINKQLVKTLLKNQCPLWARLPLKKVESSGTDNTLFRLGSEYVVRLPRIHWAAESINKEYEWVPKLAQILKTPLSVPVFKGKPDSSYPYAWVVAKWNEGYHPDFEKDNEYAHLAKELAYFLNELHRIKLANGPTSRRGVCLKEVSNETKQAINQLVGEIDIDFIRSVWHDLSNIPYWSKEPVWIHGDFLPGNILIKKNRLSAVIDFSDIGVGDPACDLVIAWSLLGSRSRSVFKENLEQVDNDTWERGRGWALSIALIMLAYYKNTNPVLTALARRMISTCVVYRHNF
jgi:aminoglycoside phosphotransferase (APT) family kinase protein